MVLVDLPGIIGVCVNGFIFFLFFFFSLTTAMVNFA